jgi:hypothetical protein
LNLTEEEQVDLILRKMPALEFLNGLAVDREELYMGEEEEEAAPEDDGTYQID